VEGPAQVDTGFACSQTCVYIGISAEILNQTHWNLIGHKHNRPPPPLRACVIAQQYYSANCVSQHYHSRDEKLGAHLKKMSLFHPLCVLETA